MSNQLSAITNQPFLNEYATSAEVRFARSIQKLLAPTVEVGSVNGFFAKYTRDSRLTLPSTRRELNGQAVQLEIAAEDERYACILHAVDTNIDLSQEDDFEWLIPDALDLLADVQAQVLAFETIQVAFAAAGAGETLTFGDADDPIKLIDDELLKLAKKARSESLAVAFGAVAWHEFKHHPIVREKAGTSISWATHPNLFHTGAQFEANYSLIDDADLGADEAIEFMFPEDSILIFARSQNSTRRSPDFMKTFRKRDQTNPFRAVVSKDGRRLMVQNDWAVDLKVTNTAGVERFNVVAG